MNSADRSDATTDGRYTAHYYGPDWRAGDSLAARITHALARVEGRRPDTLETGIHSTVDPDALERLFAPARDTSALVVLPLLGYYVHVYANGQLVVLDHESERRDSAGERRDGG